MEVPPPKLKIDPPYDPAILLPGIHPKETKTLIRKDVCTPVLTAASFTTAKAWKRPQWPLLGGGSSSRNAVW